jgi:hypothetical protein
MDRGDTGGRFDNTEIFYNFLFFSSIVGRLVKRFQDFERN